MLKPCPGIVGSWNRYKDVEAGAALVRLSASRRDTGLLIAPKVVLAVCKWTIGWSSGSEDLTSKANIRKSKIRRTTIRSNGGLRCTLSVGTNKTLRL